METKHSFSPSSSSSLPPAKRFDVFLSFRGEDTRNNFTGHLSLALRKIGLFNIFKDDYALDKGKDIGPELMKAIEDSQYAVVVLSENYATSSWCLKELAEIVDCMGDSGRIRTIFYHVNPSHVRNVVSTDVEKQKESSFWKALEEHAKNPSHSKDLESWRNALVKVANQSGHPVEAHTDEAIFIEDFVANISSELGASIRTIEGIFGMASRLKKLDSYVLQSLDTDNVCFLGIHGMGGIGKSTLARAYYKRISHKFDGTSFLQNVREVCEKKENGLVHLQEQLLKDILKTDAGGIGYVDDGIDMIRSRLRCKKVLIILDDVSKLEHLNGLAGEDKWFGKGSIIIVTSREDSFLKIRRFNIYRVEFLNASEALQLFSWQAFRSIEPPEEYKELSKLVVEYASYLPLALTVLGSLLGSKTTTEWESALCRLKRCPEKEIVEKLKISFDDLNETDQHIFLDIACFFKGSRKVFVIQMLDSCGFNSEYGISNLIDKSLLGVDQPEDMVISKIWMHDLLEEMGKDIVRKKSGNELGRQSRIWHPADLYQILENKEGMNEVEAIVTYCGKPKEYNFEALSSMKKLRLLLIVMGFMPNFDWLDDCEGPELSNNLQYLEWIGFPYNKFPPSFQPRKLVVLRLRDSNIKQLWNNGIKPLYNLKIIDLKGSQSFTKFEDFTVVPNLETLILQRCIKLSEINPSIKHLKKLILLDLEFCTSLEILPEEINGLTSLQFLKLLGCHKLKKFSSSIFLMENLKYVSGIYYEEMIEPAIRENIINYRTTDKCFFLGWFCTSLTRLDLSDCNLTGPEAFPEYFGKLVDLKHLDLSKNPFSVLPPGINGLSKLETLSLKHCKNLRCLEVELLPSSLEKVDVSYCTSLASFLDPLKPCHLRRLSSVCCLDCTGLVKRQDGNMTALASLTKFLENPFMRRDQNFEFVVPQSNNELPSWFINQSSTASIAMKFDPNWINSQLIGCAMVFCFHANSSIEDDSSIGKYFGSTRLDFRKVQETTMEMGGNENRMSDHLILLYCPSEDFLECMIQLEPQSYDTFEFSFLGACGLCGVRLVYEEDIQELKEITGKYINDHSPQEKDVQSSHSQSVSRLSTLRQMGPIGSPMWTGLRGVLDLEDKLELVEMQPYADEDRHNPESNRSMIGNTHFGVFRNYTGITTKFLDNLKDGREPE